MSFEAVVIIGLLGYIAYRLDGISRQLGHYILWRRGIER